MPEDTGDNQPTPPVTPPATTPTTPPTTAPPVTTPEPSPTTPAVDLPATPKVVVTPPTTPLTVTPPLATPPMSEEQVASLRKDITEEVSGEVSKGVMQKIADALGLSKKEEDQLPTDAGSLKKLVDTEINKRFDKESKDLESQNTEDATARQGRIDGAINNWHFQYNELARVGRVPVIKNAADVNDEGALARKKIILGIGEIIKEIQKTNPNSDYLPSISESLVRFPDILKGPPGADLPISGNTAVRENTDSFSYEKDIAGMTFEQIVKQGE